MLLGVVSDTHGHVEYTRTAVRMLESVRVDVVIHCGDIGSIEVIRLFSPWPTHFVFGNVDEDLVRLRREISDSGHSCHERFGQLEWDGRRVAFLHGDNGRLLRQSADDGCWDLICYGHTHVARQHRQGDTLLLNPGAVYRANPHSIAVVELPSLDVTLIPL